jgi:hypothetical protein
LYGHSRAKICGSIGEDELQLPVILVWGSRSASAARDTPVRWQRNSLWWDRPLKL